MTCPLPDETLCDPLYLPLALLLVLGEKVGIATFGNIPRFEVHVNGSNLDAQTQEWQVHARSSTGPCLLLREIERRLFWHFTKGLALLWHGRPVFVISGQIAIG